MKTYIISEKQVKAVNILLKIVEEAINRNTFNEEEIQKIYKMSDQLAKNITEKYTLSTS
tara:strand:- start:134 stop:310 length:177 start_codon:yes stop_codon:yes gene_type:complete